MNRKVSVYAGVVAAMVSFSAGAEEPAPESQPSVQEVHKPFSVSLLPGISTNGFSSGNVVNNLSIGLLATHAGRVDGMAVALGANWVDRELRGAELALAANYAGQVKGMQMAVGVNVAGGKMSGAQFAVGVNVATEGVRGVQGSAGINIASDMKGLQLSSGLNISAGHLTGAQLSLLNIGGDVSGAQVGLLNIAGRVKGLQLGLLNIASESDTAIGLLSLVGNGQHHVQVWGSDMSMVNVALKIGSKNMHTLFTVGLRPDRDDEQRLWATGLGLGGHIPVGSFFIDVDALTSALHRGSFIDINPHILAQLRLVAGWQPFSHFAIFGGVTANTLISYRDELKGMDRFGLGHVYYRDDEIRVQTWPGLIAGIQL